MCKYGWGKGIMERTKSYGIILKLNQDNPSIIYRTIIDS